MMKRRSNLGYFVLAAVLFFAFTLLGCAAVNTVTTGRSSKYILVQSRVDSTTRNEGVTADVTKTPRYSNMVSQINSVALSAPSSCADKTAAAATGSAENTGDVVKTRCGVEMAEIERALVRQGFTVYSWKMINNAFIANPEDVTKVAKKLGAQVLFQVNSLERAIMTPGRDARIEHNFQNSNVAGESLSPLKLDEQQINKINAVIVADELKRLPSAKRLGAMLDINAVDTATGQTIWFYRWSKHEDTSRNVLAKYLLQCWDYWGPWCRIEQGNIPEPEIPKKGSEKRSEEVATISTDPRPASERDAIYFELLRDVTVDFVKRFSSGQ